VDLGQFKIRVGLQAVNRGVELNARVVRVIFSDGFKLGQYMPILRLLLLGSRWLFLRLCLGFSGCLLLVFELLLEHSILLPEFIIFTEDA